MKPSKAMLMASSCRPRNVWPEMCSEPSADATGTCNRRAAHVIVSSAASLDTTLPCSEGNRGRSNDGMPLAHRSGNRLRRSRSCIWPAVAGSVLLDCCWPAAVGLLPACNWPAADSNLLLAGCCWQPADGLRMPTASPLLLAACCWPAVGQLLLAACCLPAAGGMLLACCG